jgi:hypothetical protein
MIESNAVYALISAVTSATAITMGWDRIKAELKKIADFETFLDAKPMQLNNRSMLFDVCRQNNRWGVYCSRATKLKPARKAQLIDTFCAAAHNIRLSPKEARQLLVRLLDGEITLFTRPDHARFVYDFLKTSQINSYGSYACLSSPERGIFAETKAKVQVKTESSK